MQLVDMNGEPFKEDKNVYNHHHSQHRFRIREFRTPKFEVKLQTNGGPHYAGDKTTISLGASYYSGAPLTNTDAKWYLGQKPAFFRPPNQENYAFGAPIVGRYSYASNGPHMDRLSRHFQGKTDQEGVHRLVMELGKISPPRPMSFDIQASVQDIDRNVWKARKRLIVHPSEYYVGLKTKKNFLEKGEELEVEMILSDIEGNLIADRPIKIQVHRSLPNAQKKDQKGNKTKFQTCEIFSKTSAVHCSFKTPVGGRYVIEATTIDDFGRENYSEITRWVYGDDAPEEKAVFELIADKKEYQPGDKVTLLVRSPVFPAQGLLTLLRAGSVEKKQFSIHKRETTVSFEVKKEYFPGVIAQVTFTGKGPRSKTKNSKIELPFRDSLAAISCGIVNGVPMLDLPYVEDVIAAVDMNVVMTGSGSFVEVQGTGEESVFSADELSSLLALAGKGVKDLTAIQAEAVKDYPNLVKFFTK